MTLLAPFTVGRTPEVEKLQKAIHSCKSNQGGAFFIAGPAGVGKSALIANVLEDQDVLAVHTRLFEESTSPYAPLIQALRTLLPQIPRSELSLLNALGVLLPGIGQPADPLDRTTLFAAMQEVFYAAANQQTLVFIIEDLHWADDSTLEALLPLLSGATQLPLLVIATYRPELLPRNARLRWLRNELRRSKNLREIELSHLDEANSRILIEHFVKGTISDDLNRRIFEQTQGLPLFIEEISKVLIAKSLLIYENGKWTFSSQQQLPIPDTIRDAVALQLEELSEPAREKLEIAAAYGLEFDLNLLVAIAGDDIGIDELLQQHLIRETAPGKAAFQHVLTKEAVKSETLWSKRRLIYRKIAEVLEHQQLELGRRAKFWLQAGETIRARQAFVASAQQYCRMHAHREAAEAAQQALEIWQKGEQETERLEVLEQIAHCTQLSGQIHDSIMALRELAESPIVQQDARRLAEVHRSLAVAYSLQSTWLQYKSSRKLAAEAFVAAQLHGEAAKEWLALANRYVADLETHAALEAIENAIALAQQAQQEDIQARALGVKGYILSIQGKSAEAQQAANEGINLALSGNHKEAAADAYRRLAGIYEYASQFDASIKAYEAALNFCQTNNISIQAQHCLPCMSWVLFRLGDWKKGLSVCKEVISDEKSFDAAKSTAHGVIGLIKAYRGETKSALTHLLQFQSLGEKEQQAFMTFMFPWGKALIYESMGEMEIAHQLYLQMLQNWEQSQDVHDVLAGLFSAIAFFADQQQEESLTRCVQIFSSISQSTGNPEAVAGLAFGLGSLALFGKNYQEAIGHFENAVKYLQELYTPVQRLQAEYFLGIALEKSGALEKALELLQKTLQEARQIGMRPFISKIELVLERLTPKKRTIFEKVTPVGIPLTERQLDILKGISEGLSNKEIASKLYLSTRTVDMHVGNILDRLNCRSRAEAVKVAAEKGMLQM
jgi:predicted ATPase/DNA-binding CsgD family transcriptional regulator